MKKIYLTLLILVLAFSFGCNKDDKENGFDYDLEILYGKWRITHLYVDGKYYDVTKYPYNSVMEPTYATFYSNGKYYGEGEFGDGYGTYTAKGSTIQCYLDGEEFLKFEIIDLQNTIVEMIMSYPGSDSTMKIKCTKQ